MEKNFTNQSATEVLRAAGAEPLESYPGNMAKKWKCQCSSCGAEIYPRMGSLVRGSKACRYCHGPNPVDPKEAEIAMLSAGVEPLEPYPGYDKHWRVRCKRCGHESTPMYCSIKKGQGACFRCGTNYGDAPAYVYLVHDAGRRVAKIGITNAYAHRLTKYADWEVVELIHVSTGHEAAEIEAEVLRKWRIDLRLGPKLSRKEMPDKGHTETVEDSALPAAVEILRKYKGGG